MSTWGAMPGGLGLDNLGPAHLQPLRGDPGVVGHVLGLVGRHPQSPVRKNAAQAAAMTLLPTSEPVPSTARQGAGEGFFVLAFVVIGALVPWGEQ
jgi:hypothetical protein